MTAVSYPKRNPPRATTVQMPNKYLVMLKVVFSRTLAPPKRTLITLFHPAQLKPQAAVDAHGLTVYEPARVAA